MKNRLLNTPSFFNSIHFAYTILIVLICVTYIPLILYGGFGTSDDFSLLLNTPNSYIEALKQSLLRSGHSSRPIYAFVQVTSLFLFKDHHFLYTIYRLCLWLMIAFLLIRVFEFQLKGISKLFFLFFISFPIFISAHFFNSFQTGYLWSILFWLFSMFFIEGTYKPTGLKSLKTSAFFLIMALLSCEIVFPLFLLNFLFPLSDYGFKWHLKSKSTLFKTHFYLVFFVLLFFAFFKIFIAPLYQIESGIYGFNLSYNSLLQSLYYFFCLFIEIPLLLIEVIPFYNYMPLILVSFIVFPVLILLKKRRDVDLIFLNTKNTTIYFLITLCFCALVFLFSNYPAVTYGNYNKMLLPSFILICLLLSNYCSFLFKSRFWLLIPCLLSLWVSSMIIQVQNVCESWEKRNFVSQNIVEKLKTHKEKEPTLVLCDVPYYLKNNYNDEHVFWTTWDFDAFLKIKGAPKNNKYLPYNYNTLVNSSIDSVNNINNVMENHPKTPFLNVESSVSFQKSFKMFKNQNSFPKTNMYTPCFRKRLRDKLKSYF